MTFDLIQWLRNQANDTLLPIQVSNLNNLGNDDSREWLITNGLGTYAGAALSGANTRRYHGLLVASLKPPVQRTLLLSRLDETLSVEGHNNFLLATNYWQSGHVSPQGYLHLEAFSELPVPTWSYRVSGGRLIKQVLMLRGQQRVHVGYTWLPDDGATTASLELSVLLGYRDFHSENRGSNNWQFAQNIVSEKQVKIEAFNGAQALWLEVDHGSYAAQPEWYWNYKWPREFERGLGDREDTFRSGVVRVTLAAGESITFSAGFEPSSASGDQSNNPEPLPLSKRLESLVRQCAAEKRALLKKDCSATAQRLMLAADQFIAHRQSTNGSTIIAGYHWFSDWGRDSMISLCGLCIATGRTDEARSILATFGRYLSEGMLPNYFPDGGQEPEYNTSDATLWWAWALHGYYKASGDINFVKEQLPLLQDVVAWHKKGTRHGLRLDSDGLITGGDASVQLTWMDAKVGNYVVTPRSGKAVEINALWYNFLLTLDYLRAEVATKLGADALPAADSHGATGEDYVALAARCRNGFEKFWLEKEGYLIDVIRQDGSADPAIRPNQLMAASLTYPLLSQERARRMLAVVESKLLTPMGMRTLSPDHPEYQGIYGTGLAQADQYHRDITYHQGTVWPWLLGPWVNARVYANSDDGAYATNGSADTKNNESAGQSMAFIRAHLQPIIAHLSSEGCIGSISEIFDGNAPHTPRGCVSQAWSVAELLRVLSEYPDLN